MPDNMMVQIVASESTPAKEAAYNRWYTDVHVPMLFKYRGMKQASRYRRVGEDDSSAKYLAFYEFESREALSAFPSSPEFAAAVEDYEKVKDELGFNMKWAASYELIKIFRR